MTDQTAKASRVPADFLKQIIRLGGIRLKLIAIIMLAVTGAIVTLSVIIIPAQEKSIRSKAFDVCNVSVLSISATAADTLLTGQTILLNDIVRGISKQRITGLEEIAIVFKKKYIVNSIKRKAKKKLPKKLYKRIKKFKGKKVFRNEVVYNAPSGEAKPAYEFIKPIYYLKKRLGFARIIYSKEAIQRDIDEAKRLTIITALVVIFLSLLLIYFTASALSKPILDVANAAAQVADGDLDVNVGVRSNDEIGTLAKQFNRMVDEIREKFHMMKFVSKSTVDMIKDTSDQHDDMELGGGRKAMAFLFSDVRGFTAMTEKKAPEEVVAILNEYLDLQSNVIKRNHGDIDKFVGDEIMAAFEGDDKEDNCIKAAIGIISAIKRHNADRTNEGKETITVGIGIHAGDVVVGNMGSQDRMDFTAIGDAVNLSARLCSAAEPMAVLATHSLLKAAKGKYTGKKLEPIKVKGKVEPIDIVSVQGFA